MQIGVRILGFLDMTDLDDALRPLIEQTENLIVDTINLLPISGKVTRHA
jgi:hypothetical protein